MEKNYRPKDYYLGLDIGTNSIGWAVTDSEYNLCRFKGKDMWGIRLFSEAKTAADRRQKRANRRRLQRRKQRIDLLQMLFAEEMSKIDPVFFIRLNESRLHMDDKSTSYKHVFFTGSDYTDIDYYKEYPTIYHLRKELISNKNAHDIRLVYLALHHILKYRGHFLIPGDVNSAKDFSSAFGQLIEVINDAFDYKVDVSNEGAIEAIFRDNSKSKSDKAKEIEKFFSIEEGDADKETIKARKTAIKEITKLIVGNKGDIKKIFINSAFEDDEIRSSFKFGDSGYDEEIAPKLESAMPEEYHVISIIKTIYDWSILSDIMNNKEFFSEAKVDAYETHKRNLSDLRFLMKKYCDKSIYKEFFDGKNVAGNYAEYVGGIKTNGKKISQEKKTNSEGFYKNIKRILDSIASSVETEDKEEFDRMYKETEFERLLPLQRSKDNGAVPKQVHEQELRAILDNASEYLSFLKNKDEDGLTTADKIVKIFNFRIPYFVGPLSDRHKAAGANVWSVRKEEGFIYPWNIEKKISYEKSNEAFITHMTNKCTYLDWEDVLPKNSLLYQRYMVLNELNNLKVRGRSLTVEQKKNIFHDLFEKKNKVRGKDLLNYLQKDDKDITLEDLSGFDIDFKASLSSYLDFKNKVFGERIKEDRIKVICEDVIRWATIYGDDSSMIEKIVTDNYGSELSKDQVKEIRRLRYSGWGQFSKAFLEGVDGIDTESGTGEITSIIRALWETNCNLMQVLSSRFTFAKEIEVLKAEHANVITKISYDELVDDLYTSPANKRAIWQTIQIAEEIRKVMGCEPKKIFVEMARGGEKEKKRTISRKQRLIDLYEACEKDSREWSMLEDIKGHEERDFNSMKLYLYYTQMGKCAYTGEAIDVDALMRGNSNWDRDHIYPQSRIKDDSIDNLVLVKKTVNAKKDNELLSAEIQKKMYPTWKTWLESGFISKSKFERLTRKDDFSDDELSGFVARQLVETRQSTKLVAERFGQMYPNSRIVRVKAGLVSDFRQSPLKELKSRRVNDYHHAKDAYLNIVVGNVYSVRFTDNPREWVKKNRDKEWSINKVFFFDVDGAWKAPDKEKGEDNKRHALQDSEGYIVSGSIDLVRKTVRKNTVLYTEHTLCEKGELFKATLQKKGKAGTIPLKKGLDTDKYGGYHTPKTSYFAQIEFDGKKGERVKNIIGVPIYVANMLGHNPNAFVEYCEQTKGFSNVKVLIPLIKKNSLLVVNGFPMRIRGEDNENILFKSNMQLTLDFRHAETIRRMEKWLEKKQEIFSKEHDGLSEDDIISLYDMLLKKIDEGPYRGRPAKQNKTMTSGRTLFLALSQEDKIKTINEIMKMFTCGIETTANLTSIGGTPSAGSMKMKKNTVGKNNVKLINQSVTGLFENQIKL